MYTIIKLTVLLALKCATLSRALQVSRINYVSTISFDRVLSLSSYSNIIALVLLYKTKVPLYIEITTKTAHSSCCTTIRIFMALKYKRINWKKTILNGRLANSVHRASENFQNCTKYYTYYIPTNIDVDAYGDVGLCFYNKNRSRFRVKKIRNRKTHCSMLVKTFSEFKIRIPTYRAHFKIIVSLVNFGIGDKH